jgi:hypothetical protein
MPPSAANSARLEPPAGTYFGVNLDWGTDTATAFNERLGKRAAVYVQFARFPFDDGEWANLLSFVDQVADQGGIALVTLEPFDGLAAVTPEVAADLGERLREVNFRGVPVVLRFAHEMNGSWYPWSQRPEEYIRSFRLVADAVHGRAPLTATLWAPNYGSGYPYLGGAYAVTRGSRDWTILDTNRDGVIDMRDDPYAPFYPGDDAVDWVGMSIYHWGYEYPWGENLLPEPNKLVAQLTGTYATPRSDERTLPNFYRIYADQHAKPMAIPETAAFYRPGGRGADEYDVKRSWLQQVLGGELTRQFPRIKLINWFEWVKFENEVDGVVDWRLASDPALVQAAREMLGSDQWLFAEADSSITR